jgi:hypothetical protein
MTEYISKSAILGKYEEWQDYAGITNIIATHLPGRCQRDKRTIYNWSRRGLINCRRTKTNKPLFSLPDVLSVLEID